ncbi:hypothetical protein PR048_007231, partial [Dryococelus australis]
MFYIYHKPYRNEIIEMMGDLVRKTIIADVIQAKYYTIMFDCALDVSYNEQMRVSVKSKKEFINLLEVIGKTGDYLTQTITKKLGKDGLEIRNCCGQSYDNGLNMAGVYKGLQARILESNPPVMYVPCIAHSLNLVRIHASSVSAETSNAFGLWSSPKTLQVFFAFSTQRWEIMKIQTKTNLKGTSQTRWSTKSEAVQALTKNIHGALNELTEGQLQPETTSKTGSLLRALLDFQFISYLVACPELLKEINIVNKEVHKGDIILSRSIEILKGLTNTMQRLRDTPREWLKTAKRPGGSFPNICVALRIYITLPTTYAGCEQSFKRLTNLPIMSIERDEANLINYKHAIDLFAERK